MAGIVIPYDNPFGLDGATFYPADEVELYFLSGEYMVKNIKLAGNLQSFILAGEQSGGTNKGFVITCPDTTGIISVYGDGYKKNSQTGEYVLVAEQYFMFDISSPDSFTYEDQTVRANYNPLVRVPGSSAFMSYDHSYPVMEGNFWSGGQYSIPERARRYGWLMQYGGYTSGYLVTYSLTNCEGAPSNPDTIPIPQAITNFSFIPDENAIFNHQSVSISGTDPVGNPITFVFDYETGQLRIGAVGTDITITVNAYKDPYVDIDGEGDLPGGETIPVPSIPPASASQTGMFTLFSPTAQQMQNLASYLWTDFSDPDPLNEIVAALKRLVADPLKLVLGLSIIPSQGLTKGSVASVRVGFWDTGVGMTRLTSQFFDVNCGTLSFSALCGDTFLDYAPYSKFSIYLPYVGTKVLDANDCVGHTIGVRYRGDAVTGALACYITKDGSVLYQYSGNCALNLPLSAESWANAISAAMNIVGSVANGIGSVAGTTTTGASTNGKGKVTEHVSKSLTNAGAGGIVGMASSIASNAAQLSPQVAISGVISGGAGHLSVQKPYIIREAVSFHSTVGFNTLAGYPSHYFRTLSTLSGFTKCLAVHVHGVPCLSEEISEIESLLLGGVII